MKSTTNLKNNIIIAICYLHAFLFTYAAISKILDYHDFSIKLGQSPLLSAFAGYVATGVPVLELIIVLMLIFPRWRITGLYAAFCLMIAFTVYIFIILNYSSYVPCSCGGILQDLGWTEHLVFNLVFIFLALIALILSRTSADDWLSSMRPMPFSLTILGGGLIISLSVIILFLTSEDIIHKRNNFVRRFPSHAEPAFNKIDLKINSYYFAGINGKTIYLGNVTAPAYVTLIDTSLKNKSRSWIEPDQPDLPFHDIKLSVIPPYFFITDGTVPAIFKGKTNNWKAKRQSGQIPYFTIAEPMDSLNIALRLTSLTKKQNTIATYNLMEKRLLKENTTLLKTQLNSIFDTDGMLHYNTLSNQLHYIFYYRNQFISTNKNLQLMAQGKTIDTVETASITLSTMSSGDKQIAKPPLVVNKATAIYKNLLFIKSDRIGRFEDKTMLEDASIVDVYDLSDNTYVGSLYIYHIDGNKMRSFKVIDDKLYALSGKYLSVNKVPNKFTNEYNTAKK
ncbi:MauE/DoxX family redox-associated membrane protein [Flavobacterium granuli]|uniref:Methylamine utilisation protein MauE domain-containing protein n=1 Tax=Flavobacterium granuli TaxID=280093 RepID=A0A1M5RJE2_9FLAO|nr:hypothetical protein BC624_10694 [Flavobacterium granuli]SHH26427.1 hypothetical protein SAMN05443373_11027 [Flavobacterium granuli]